MAALVRRWVKPDVRAMGAYSVPSSAGLIKLDAMENPYGWPEELRRQWLEELDGVALNRYPDPRAGQLIAALRDYFEIPDNADLLIGNGSDELIQLLALALAGEGRVLMAPEPTFVMYRLIATFVGLRYRPVPLRTADFSLDVEAFEAAIAREQPALIFLASPNNPTGNALAPEAVLRIVERAPGLVVVDEAYLPFADHSFRGELGRHTNLLWMGTLSKMGLAGLRVGFLAGPAAWVDELDKLRLPYNSNVLSQASAAFALRHAEVLERQAQWIRGERARLQQSLDALDSIRAYPSQANFILFRTPAGRATEIFSALRRGGVLIKNLHGSAEALRDCLRVTVGQAEENQRFMQLLSEALQAPA